MNIKKLSVLYFSPTGGTEKIARYVAGELGKKLGLEPEYIPFTKPAEREGERRFGPGELLVMASPVYAGRLPNKIMPEYKAKIFGDGAIALPICVFGNRSPDEAPRELALLLGVTASIVGVTMVAIGTSLPELVTTLTAIAKKEASMSVGNIIGANVIDLTMILPVCSAVSGGALTIGAQTTLLDMPACLLLCCAAVLPPLVTERFYRWQGVLMLGLYAGYIALLVT